MQTHKYKVNSVVQHGDDRAKVVGYCIPNEWDTEPRYGIELLDRVEKSVRYRGLSQVYMEFPIVKAVGESSLTLLESPTEEKEVTVADVVAEIERDNVANAMVPSGV